jgi:hypothetical protein
MRCRCREEMKFKCLSACWVAMPSRRNIKGVLRNFLGTFTSRYSDVDGYWVYGYLVEDFKGLNINLLEPNADNANASPSAFVIQLAKQKFEEQISKAKLQRTWLCKAHLEVLKLPESRTELVNGRSSSGYEMRFLTRAVTDLGQNYEAALSIFVAPHDPKVERRSTRANKQS